MATVMAACRQLTQLTTIGLYCRMEPGGADGDAQAVADARSQISAMCQHLKQLTNLRVCELDLDNWVDMQPDDLLHLTSLTCLTELWLRVDNLGSSTALIAALLELTTLQCLTLSRLKELNVLPAIGKLQRLTHLELQHLPEDLQPQGLKYLTKLRNLRELEGFDSCSKEVI